MGCIVIITFRSSGGPARLELTSFKEARRGGPPGVRPASMYEVYRAESKDAVLKIFRDEDAPNPREWDNLGTMVCGHRRYRLGDEQAANTELYGSWDEWLEGELGKDVIALPLYLYDHGGLAMSTEGWRYPFNDPWDAGQVGWIYVTKEKVRREYGVKRVTRKVRDRVLAVLEAEVEEYSRWLEGDVYGYVLEDAKGNEIDSCWGFFGTDWHKNGMADQIPVEYLFLLEKAA